jgi:hypothetical protein
MESDEAYLRAEQRISHARSSGATHLFLNAIGLSELPASIASVSNLVHLDLSGNKLVRLSPALGELKSLESVFLDSNNISDLPASISGLNRLIRLNLDCNPLNPELAATYKEGLDAMKRYLRAKAKEEVALNEAKLILIGEGDVGKSSLLAALRGDPWVDGRPTTHGIEIKAVEVTAPGSGTRITLNGCEGVGPRIMTFSPIRTVGYGLIFEPGTK